MNARPRISSRILLFLGVVLCSSTVVAHAQTALYGEFSIAKQQAQNSSWAPGGTVGLYHDQGHYIIALGEDVRGTFLSKDNTHFREFLVGPRVAVTPHVVPIKPYVEALIGVGNYGTSSKSSTDFAYQFLGGVDFTFFPRLDWRVIEFSYGGLSIFNGTYNPKTISTGLVFRLP